MVGGAVGYFLLWVSLRKAESAAEETQMASQCKHWSHVGIYVRYITLFFS